MYLDARFADKPAPSWGRELADLRDAAEEAIALFPAGPAALRPDLYVLAGLVQAVGDSVDRMMKWLEAYEYNGGGPAAMVFPAELAHFLDLVPVVFRWYYEGRREAARAGRFDEVPMGNGTWRELPRPSKDLDEVLDLFRYALATLDESEADGKGKPRGRTRKAARPAGSPA